MQVLGKIRSTRDQTAVIMKVPLGFINQVELYFCFTDAAIYHHIEKVLRLYLHFILICGILKRNIHGMGGVCMGWLIVLILVILLGTVLLLPVRVPFSVEGSHWRIQVFYAWFRIWQKDSAEESAPQTELPPPSPSPAPPPTPMPAPPPPPAPSVPSVPAQEISAAESECIEDFGDDALLFTDEDAEMTEEPEKKSFFQKIRPTCLSEWKGLIGDVLASLGAPLGLLTRHLHFVKLRVRVNVATDDAAKTAVTYGTIGGLAYWLLGQLQCIFDVQAEEFSIRPDFLGKKMSFSVHGELRSTPISLLSVMLGAGVRFLYHSWVRVRRQDKEQKLTAAEESAVCP